MSEFTRFRHSRVLLYSDPVKEFLVVDELPVKGSPEYYTAMVHRDTIIKGRHLAMANDQSPFALRQCIGGYASFVIFGSTRHRQRSLLVAMRCSSCVKGIETIWLSGNRVNIYSPNIIHKLKGTDFFYLQCKPTSFKYPVVNLTMNGGDRFSIHDPIVVIPTKGGGLYCLGVVKSDSVNIIGQNFMTVYRIVDREKMVLGWKASDCYDVEASNTLPVIPPMAVLGYCSQSGSHIGKWQ
ncbi:hypothetical protein F3Y22_tig00110387pilonHSYRG00966 [Hibiscus syriacus]|uniref:Peptidase A1 domain-containing protein n=1 Tax=Hibiscus syriacus TaxID=106335 RepID=A0A6A3ATB5_HIBSY|nr:hypothetical protein F3Y22_tig00110387pilonHSYRG00966 [Hibiscus syriacus]